MWSDWVRNANRWCWSPGCPPWSPGRSIGCWSPGRPFQELVARIDLFQSGRPDVHLGAGRPVGRSGPWSPGRPFRTLVAPSSHPPKSGRPVGPPGPWSPGRRGGCLVARLSQLEPGRQVGHFGRPVRLPPHVVTCAAAHARPPAPFFLRPRLQQWAGTRDDASLSKHRGPECVLRPAPRLAAASCLLASRMPAQPLPTHFLAGWFNGR